MAAGHAQRQAGAAAGGQAMAARPPAPGPQQGAAPNKTGVTEAQGAGGANEREAGKKIVVFTSGLLFATNSAEVSTAAKPKLDQVADALKAQPQSNRIEINGYTDDTGSSEGNMHLSQQRAQAVANYLESKGVSKDHISVQGFGSEDPISSDKTVEGRAVNRRVDILVAESGQGPGAKGATEKQGGQQQGATEKQGGSQSTGQPSQPSPQSQPQQQQKQQHEFESQPMKEYNHLGPGQQYPSTQP
jgi:outer membrane protein OmpA-like peptidoglycan-associated protein